MWISDVMELVRALWRARITFFWPIWIASAVMGALGVALVVGHASTPIISKGSITPERRQVWTRNAVAAMISLCVFLGCYVSLIPIWEDFCYPDNSMSVSYTHLDVYKRQGGKSARSEAKSAVPGFRP